MKTKLNFKIKINNQHINSVDKTKRGYYIFIDDKKLSMKKIVELYYIIIECDECNNEFKLKNLQQLIKNNKIYLCKSCRNKGNRNGMFNKKHSEETIKKLKLINSGEKNNFYGKKHSEITKLKQKNSKLGVYDGEKNPMYRKSVLDVWIEKYGIDDAMDMWIQKYSIHSNSMLGEKNPMYRKSVLDVWIEKYGIDDAMDMYDKWKLEIKDSLLLFYKKNPEYKKFISDKLKGRMFTDEHRKNLRLSSIEYVKNKLKLNGGKLVPHFNIAACNLFDKISEIKKIDIIHALNGGEYHIKELGYWVDGYDKKNNTVYEYYEKHHNYKFKRDSIRESEIISFLNCNFIIIKEGDENEYINNLL